MDNELPGFIKKDEPFGQWESLEHDMAIVPGPGGCYYIYRNIKDGWTHWKFFDTIWDLEVIREHFGL
jgi:hypothetical protein